MTEQQFEKLKELLHSSDASDNSNQLDQKILSAAHQQAVQAKQEQQNQRAHRRMMSWLTSILQAGLIQAAVLSVTLTLALFFVFGQIIHADAPVLLSNDFSTHNDVRNQNLPVITFTRSNNRVANSNIETQTHSFEVLDAPEMVSSRDQLLEQMQLPDIDTLLDDMIFDDQNDRQLAQSTITLAISDINSMLNTGELETARQRYAELKKSCEVCELPDTLEALAASYRVSPSRG